MNVISTFVRWTAVGSTSNGFCDVTTRSASLPTSIVPTLSPWPIRRAPFQVRMRSASSSVTCSCRPRVSSLPPGTWRVTIVSTASHGSTRGTTGQSEPAATRAPVSRASRIGTQRFIRSSPTALRMSIAAIGVGNQM